ncbi:hypothetical protein CLOHAE12215_01349 [Clostridium haemolyticum]|uniref:hypothetical protein n=1 Tax=Clostridium TaxID=1485 RepID=UPI001C399A6B|nr:MULTISPECIES: hypothetical protein [Clostridium]MCD3217334.1 hypothetical protein [Clostridium botulinum C]CAG7839933.1 hypothetical protein CLOHAE12215_01349 [Clostridium haemolyticum]
MINRQLYTMKFKSSRLKKYNYDIQIDYEQALDNGEIIALGDNQLLRTIRDVIIDKTTNKEKIKKRILDRNLLEEFYTELDKIKIESNSKENIQKVKEINQKIIDMCFIPEYITIVMENDKHYDYLYKHGLKINGIPYFRLSVSAGQGRVRTVVFCSSEVLETVNTILDNGRDKTKKFSPSKFNAYKGTYGSATKVVTTPRFCVVPDYFSDLTFKVNWVTETEGENDDIVEEKEITRSYNRWDGMGLISPRMAKQWSKDLDLDYIPAEFCVRQSFIKGMLAVFPIHEFCKKKNGCNYTIKSLYKDQEGNQIEIDLRDYDVIITESQFKLWDSYPSLEVYKENCKKHNLKWGVSLYTDKELKHNLKMNYQFLQVNNIQKQDIPKLCEEFVDWIKGVNSENIWYTLLFLLGTHITQSSIKKYLKSTDNYWVKSLIVNHNLINDSYIKDKIYNLIKTQIDNGCMGNILLSGNNQTLVSDPYGMMEYICGLEVKGLLGANEYYSDYWNSQGIKEIIGMRPPLTYRSEVTKLNLVNTKEQQYWYRYLYGGIIVNIHGHETDNWAGSDFDYDFLSTTSNEVLIKSRYSNEYPVTYEAPKPNKFVFTDEDLYKSDKFTFGSIIGGITNKSTSGYALLEDLKRCYGIESREYQTTLNRIKMCTKLQSAQIDKAKIGRNVKGIPKTWIDRKYINSLDVSKEEKDFLKRIMLDRYPYFFIHLYPSTKRKYKKFVEGYDLSSIHKFGIGINELIQKENKTQAEQEYINAFYEYMPVIDSNSVMNNICKYIESIDFDIKHKINANQHEDIHLILMRNENIVNKDTYNKILKEYKSFKKEIKLIKSVQTNMGKNKYDESQEQSVNVVYEKFKNIMNGLCSNTYELVDYLIHIFYVEFKNDNKNLLWNCYGDIIFQNVKDKNQKQILFPMPNKKGDIKYLNKYFKLMEVDI